MRSSASSPAPRVTLLPMPFHARPVAGAPAGYALLVKPSRLSSAVCALPAMPCRLSMPYWLPMPCRLCPLDYLCPVSCALPTSNALMHLLRCSGAGHAGAQGAVPAGLRPARRAGAGALAGPALGRDPLGELGGGQPRADCPRRRAGPGAGPAPVQAPHTVHRHVQPPRRVAAHPLGPR